MLWHLTVTFEEDALRDNFWDLFTDMPQVAPLIRSGVLYTRRYTDRPAAAFLHHGRETLAPLARYVLDFWPSAQINLSRGDPDHGRTSVYVETGD